MSKVLRDWKKYSVLAVLVLQNSALTLTLHHTRVRPVDGNGRYLASTAILLVEVIKLIVSFGLSFHETCRNHPSDSPPKVLTRLFKEVFAGDGWKLSVPAVLYTLQSSLLYRAISNLNVATFQVTYQLRILTTALFSVLLLRRQLSVTKWLALFLLTFGIAVVQVPEASLRAKSLLSLLSPHEETSELMVRDEKVKRTMAIPGPAMNASLGLAAVLAASVTSGLTGVYFEKVVKNPSVTVSIWTRNIQLSFYSLFPALFLGVIYTDGQEISKNGFFVGYNSLVWTTIFLQVLGGFTAGLCIVHLDNIAKNFALCVSIIVSLLFDIYVFGSSVPINFVFGAAIVMFALYLYSRQLPLGK
ncbi:nucleotide-sugar transporter [Mollisia scopiformis]|uniref:Nucleotide-sugar transporter n=1 Tax=Mollisia scopiformis TaxID=149040 RepID=A0A132B793_MOLSC|nr:nucleotide-sugar transporter [Mollisia scopiformis]KUJ08278.1 nucleotide-sugar transporter [Mollisia scopiformis]